MGVFSQAIAAMQLEGLDTFGPVAFQEYAKSAEAKYPTAPSISVDAIHRLDPDLRSAKIMVFRLGAGERSSNSRFALARTTNGWTDYFLQDQAIFADTSPEIYVPRASMEDLFAFQMLPSFTESSYVNLSLASGLLAHALQLDEPAKAVIPATGQSVFSFQVRPHSAFPDVWEHRKGQVEVDALFVGKRRGKQHLFLIEAKVSSDWSSLAKHKLVYPVLGLRQSIPTYLPIVPVYLRAISMPDGVHFHVCECEWNGGPSDLPSVSQLQPKQSSRWVLRL